MRLNLKNGDVEVLVANAITENLLAQIDEQGHIPLMLEDIVDHRLLSDATPISKGIYKTPGGTTRRVSTMRGWEIYVTWKDRSSDWISMKDLKDLYPVQLAKFAIASGIDEEPAFAWCVPFTIRKRKRLI